MRPQEAKATSYIFSQRIMFNFPVQDCKEL